VSRVEAAALARVLRARADMNAERLQTVSARTVEVLLKRERVLMASALAGTTGLAWL